MCALRFTFVAGSGNRTAVAALASALEGLAEADRISIRVARPADAPALPFGDLPATVEVLGMSATSESVAGTARLLARIAERARKAGLAGPSRPAGPGGSGGKPFLSICGGPHATGNPESVLEAGFDYCCVGEGEEVIRRLARDLLAGTPVAGTPLSSAQIADSQIAGARSAGTPPAGTAGRILRGGTQVDLDGIPALPRRMIFRGYIEIARGCRWACAYCQNPGIFGHVERFRSPRQVEETVALYWARAMKDIRLLAPNAFGYAALAPRRPNCEALDDLLGRVRAAAPGGRIFFGSFPSEVRPDYVTPEAVAILKRYVANRKLVIGGQSGSQRILDLIDRGHSVEDIARAAEIAAAAGFEPLVDLMVGFPFEEPEDREASLALIERLRPARARFTMHFFMPLPGTRLAEAPPRFLTDAERRHIDGLAQQGLIRGRWRRQEEFARRCAKSVGPTSPNP